MVDRAIDHPLTPKRRWFLKTALAIGAVGAGIYWYSNQDAVAEYSLYSSRIAPSDRGVGGQYQVAAMEEPAADPKPVEEPKPPKKKKKDKAERDAKKKKKKKKTDGFENNRTEFLRVFILSKQNFKRMSRRGKRSRNKRRKTRWC